MSRRIWITVGLVLAGGPALAADAASEAARRCAQMQDSLQRLVCYDRIFAAPAAPAVASAPAPAQAPAARPAPAPVSSPVVGTPVTGTPVVAAPVAPAAAAPAFGEEQVKRPVEERKRDEGPETLTAKVTVTREVRPGTWRLTLDNGQVWQQTEADSHFFIREGDGVVIQRGFLGGYQLEAERGGRRVRVTRVK